MSTGASPPEGGASPPLQGSPGGVITVVKSTARQVDAVEQQLQALASALTHGGGAQAATLRHLELFEAAVQGLKVGAGAAQLLSTAAAATRWSAVAAQLRHSPLRDAAARLSQDSAEEAAARRDELLVAAKRLALELRGLDLLAGHVQVWVAAAAHAYVHVGPATRL